MPNHDDRNRIDAVEEELEEVERSHGRGGGVKKYRTLDDYLADVTGHPHGPHRCARCSASSHASLSSSSGSGAGTNGGNGNGDDE